MKIQSDISGLDEFIEEYNREINQQLIYTSKEAVKLAKNTRTYKNRTGNLRSAPGAAVIRDGEIIDLYVPGEPGHEEAKKLTENLLIYGEKPEDGIVIADGMPYTTFVESKGYDVISDAAIEAEKIANRKLNK